jgi:hypothetical protein
MTEETAVSTRKRARFKPSGGPKTAIQANTEALLFLYDRTMAILEEGIKKGATNAPLGLISFMAYIDFLHGGAYAAPINEIPFFMKDPSKSKWYAGDLQNTDVAQGLGGFLGSILGGLNAGPLVQEVFADANVPHVFPKLMSDTQYAMFKAIFAWLTTTDLLKSASTGVATFVEATGRAIETAGKGVKAAMPSGEQLKELLPLLSLVAGA